jgi:hypothetical protein
LTQRIVVVDDHLLLRMLDDEPATLRPGGPREPLAAARDPWCSFAPHRRLT